MKDVPRSLPRLSLSLHQERTSLGLNDGHEFVGVATEPRADAQASGGVGEVAALGILQLILENLLMTKLTVAVENWDPRVETVPRATQAWHPSALGKTAAY